MILGSGLQGGLYGVGNDLSLNSEHIERGLENMLFPSG